MVAALVAPGPLLFAPLVGAAAAELPAAEAVAVLVLADKAPELDPQAVSVSTATAVIPAVPT
jgi:hypothetical protein